MCLLGCTVNQRQHYFKWNLMATEYFCGYRIAVVSKIACKNGRQMKIPSLIRVHLENPMTYRAGQVNYSCFRRRIRSLYETGYVSKSYGMSLGKCLHGIKHTEIINIRRKNSHGQRSCGVDKNFPFHCFRQFPNKFS